MNNSVIGMLCTCESKTEFLKLKKAHDSSNHVFWYTDDEMDSVLGDDRIGSCDVLWNSVVFIRDIGLIYYNLKYYGNNNSEEIPENLLEILSNFEKDIALCKQTSKVYSFSEYNDGRHDSEIRYGESLQFKKYSGDSDVLMTLTNNSLLVLMDETAFTEHNEFCVDASCVDIFADDEMIQQSNHNMIKLNDRYQDQTGITIKSVKDDNTGFIRLITPNTGIMLNPGDGLIIDSSIPVNINSPLLKVAPMLQADVIRTEHISISDGYAFETSNIICDNLVVKNNLFYKKYLADALNGTYYMIADLSANIYNIDSIRNGWILVKDSDSYMKLSWLFLLNMLFYDTSVIYTVEKTSNYFSAIIFDFPYIMVEINHNISSLNRIHNIEIYSNHDCIPDVDNLQQYVPTGSSRYDMNAVILGELNGYGVANIEKGKWTFNSVNSGDFIIDHGHAGYYTGIIDYSMPLPNMA